MNPYVWNTYRFLLKCERSRRKAGSEEHESSDRGCSGAQPPDIYRAISRKLRRNFPAWIGASVIWTKGSKIKCFCFLLEATKTIFFFLCLCVFSGQTSFIHAPGIYYYYYIFETGLYFCRSTASSRVGPVLQQLTRYAGSYEKLTFLFWKYKVFTIYFLLLLYSDIILTILLLLYYYINSCLLAFEHYCVFVTDKISNWRNKSDLFPPVNVAFLV